MVSHIADSIRPISRNELLERQSNYLQDREKTRRSEIFEDVLSKLRGGSEGDISAEWIFIDYKDAGERWRKESELYCECGRKLRYQYTLENRQTGLRKSFGLNHLTEHTGIPPESARKIVKELNCLAAEQEELVKKWKEGWTLESEGITNIPPDIDLPENILKPLRCHMPLLKHQVLQLQSILKQHERLEIEKKLQEIVEKEKEQLKQDSFTSL